MKGNKKVANNKGVPNERRRLSLRPRTTPIAKTPVIPEGSKKSKNSKKSTQEREPSHVSLSVTDESEREGSESERSKKSTPEREPSYQSRSISDESEREGSESETIHSVLEPNIGEEMVLVRIIDLEREYDRQGSPSETWNHWLTVKQKSIWWEELYDLDQAAQVFTKKKDKEKVTLAEASSSDSSLQGLEERLLDFMGEAFVGLNFTVETKLEAVDLRLGGIEKNQRLLRCRAKKIEKRLTSIENKVSEKPNRGEDMDFGQCDGTDFGQWDGKEKDDAEEEEKEKSGKEKEKSGEVDKDKENSETDEENGSERELNELKERCRVHADELWREVEAAEAEEDQANDERKEAETNEESIENSEDDEKVEASESPNSEPRFESPINEPRFESPINEPRVEADKTPTPPSGGRTKAMAARRVVHSPPNTWPVVVEAKEKAIEKAVELEKKTTVEADEKTSEKAVEAEEKTSEKAVERMDGTKEATRPRIRHRCKEKTMTSGKPTPKRRGRPRRSIADAAPKKSDCTPHASKGRGKRKCEPSQWVQTPFTRGKKPKTKA
ncbi:hypothetical protein HID58_061008 [Brassica napus]|uniref:DUF287 domain-containing protein n=1 Tax=Brassica napus TaxID=3708 RepID=A0ABQ7ZXG5_BRANA|nr:hypothetical protein HID58_061008 [Brassica napus]